MEAKKDYSESERNWGMFTHLSALAGFVFPMGGVLGPLIFWLLRKEESEWVDKNGKASINFQLSILLYIVLALPLLILLIGFLIIPALLILRFICVIIASVRTGSGEVFRYPLSIPFLQ